MREYFKIDRNSLVVQIVLSFLALILLTTTAVGLPAVLLIRSQAERQTLARINQGSQTTAALYNARQRRIDDLAFLTSQRPTLRQLLSQQQEAALTNYLQALQKDTELDLLLMLDELHQERAWTNHLLEAITEGIVDLDENGQIIFFSPGAERITGWKQDEALKFGTKTALPGPTVHAAANRHTNTPAAGRT